MRNKKNNTCFAFRVGGDCAPDWWRPWRVVRFPALPWRPSLALSVPNHRISNTGDSCGCEFWHFWKVLHFELAIWGNSCLCCQSNDILSVISQSNWRTEKKKKHYHTFILFIFSNNQHINDLNSNNDRNLTNALVFCVAFRAVSLLCTRTTDGRYACDSLRNALACVCCWRKLLMSLFFQIHWQMRQSYEVLATLCLRQFWMNGTQRTHARVRSRTDSWRTRTLCV